MDNLILKVCTKVLFTPIILFGLYVQFHGDFGPGGGFQARSVEHGATKACRGDGIIDSRAVLSYKNRATL